MNIKESIREIEARTGIQRIVLLLLAGLIASNFILVLMAFSNKSTHRETLVPPDIYKSFWVDGQDISPEYLEQMGKFILDLAVNNTPVNCDTNKVLLLKYTGSGSYNALNTQLSTNCEIVKSSRVSSFFAPSSVALNGKDKSVVFIGSWVRWMNDRQLNPRPTAFRIRFGYSGGRIYVKALDEVDHRAANLFDDQANKKDVMEEMRADNAKQIAEGKAIAAPAAPPPSPPATPSTDKPAGQIEPATEVKQ